jgi:tetratricopeptide (TPR) repeat protein
VTKGEVMGMSGRVKVSVTPLRLPMYRFNEDPFPPLQRTGTARVYPYPMQDDVTDELTEREFTAVILDNGLLRVTVLPEFGGHIHSVRDLKNDREVFYRNEPLKFGLIALRGAWYSGGLEFNFPQVGHTVTTNDPLPWHLTENPDGSVTLSVGTIERLTRMAWTASVTLRPNDWRLHTRIWLFNRTPFWHRIYFWTNVAVPARNDFRFLLPCTQVFSWWWGARGIANFPIQDGTDLSRYTTHKRPTDLFAKDLRADWFGCYYEELDYGVLHHANRFEVHGRKLWTWGTADDGKVWTNLLCDEGKPYCEIQSGRFVHQGVHRLMPPRAVETWSEAWFPVWGLGGVLHASDKIAVNAQRSGSQLRLKFFALVPMDNATVTVRQGEKVLERMQVNLPAGEPVALTVNLHSDAPVFIAVQDGKHTALQVKLLLEGESVKVDYRSEPAPHIGLPEHHPSELTTPTSWLLKAREHEERNELDAAAECYRKALSLDPQCVSAMNGLAQWHLKRGEWRQAREWAQKALSVDPQNEDALWWQAMASYWDEGRGTGDEVASLWALTRSNTYAAAAFAVLGELSLRRNDYRTALDCFARALERNPQDSKTLALSAFAARKLGDFELAQSLLNRCEQVNPLEPLLWSERHFLRDTGQGTGDTGREGEAPAEPISSVRREAHPPIKDLRRIFVDEQLWLDAVCDYEQIGAWGTVSVWFAIAKRFTEQNGSINPMLLYHAAYAMWRMGKLAEAMALLQDAQKQSPVFVFPYRHEDAVALQVALTLDPHDALAHYLLGTWLASVGRWDEAMAHWRKVTNGTGDEGRGTRETTLQALAWRNIGLMQRVVRNDLPAAEQAYDKAIELVSRAPSPLSPYAWRLWHERDSVLAALGQHEKRVQLFEGAPKEVASKPQIVARWAEAYARVGNYAKTVELLSQGNFKPWEGEFALRQLWKEAQMQLGHQAMREGDFARARKHFEAAADYPQNLNVGRPHWTDDADALFWAGWCALKAGNRNAALRLLRQAADELQPPNAHTAAFKRQAEELLRQVTGNG